jgi:16S rRNA C967 or C1407 C5-methylase (RsmB/RsmF family)
MDDASVAEGLEMSEVETMQKRLVEIAEAARGGKMTFSDASIVREELEQVLRMLQLSADMGIQRLGGPKPKNLKAKADDVRKNHERVWLLRNRPGGLSDSTDKFING